MDKRLHSDCCKPLRSFARDPFLRVSFSCVSFSLEFCPHAYIYKLVSCIRFSESYNLNIPLSDNNRLEVIHPASPVINYINAHKSPLMLRRTLLW